ncbi:MAG TPA: alpha/beta hydrolase [Caulobacteraceae bacterium]|nr:alpha/beta hydrolase [Caulobacteraceae bacterium]
MATIVVAHGAWSAGWAWRKMRPLMAARGHALWTPTYTGLGERSHLASPQVNLETQITDIVQVLEMEDLADVVLVGHSYGGMVATGVADKVPGRLQRVIYLDAFVPEDGDSLATLAGQTPEAMRASADDGWRAPPRPVPADTPEADREWIAARRMSHPVECFCQPIHLTGAGAHLPRHYIYALKKDPRDSFGRFYQQAKTTPGWTAHEIDSSHNPHITVPETLAEMLDGIIREGEKQGPAR